MAHRPMYCSNNKVDDCSNFRRDKVKNSLEYLFFKYNVTIEFWAHEHSYERTCPLYNGNCSYIQNYIGKKKLYNYPIHITTGAGGTIEGIENFMNNNIWSIVRIPEYGYGILNVNNSFLEWNQYSINNKNNVVLSDRLILKNF